MSLRVYALVGLMVATQACQRHDPVISVGALCGTWRVDRMLPDSRVRFCATIVVDGQGHYQSDIIESDGATHEQCTSRVEGSYELHEGCLVDHVLKHTNDSFPTPWYFRAQILRYTGAELRLRGQGYSCDVTMTRVGP